MGSGARKYATAFALELQGILRPELKDVFDRRVRWIFRHQGVKEWWHVKDRVPVATDITARINELITAA